MSPNACLSVSMLNGCNKKDVTYANASVMRRDSRTILDNLSNRFESFRTRILINYPE